MIADRIATARVVALLHNAWVAAHPGRAELRRRARTRVAARTFVGANRAARRHPQGLHPLPFRPGDRRPSQLGKAA